MQVKLQDVVPTPDRLMGVKAVWGRSGAALVCFGSRDKENLTGPRYFQQARSAASKAMSSPYLITIGGGKSAPEDLQGRALELVRVTGAYGETSTFVDDPSLLDRLVQWPVAVVVSEIYSIEGEPHLLTDLGLPDRRILRNAFDTVRRDEERVVQLFEALANTRVSRRWDVLPPLGFIEPNEPTQVDAFPELTDLNGPEGRIRWAMSKSRERDRRLRTAAIDANRSSNDGFIVCEGCRVRGQLRQVFDVHHRLPLSAGDRETRVDDLAVLCPNCHRCCHVLAEHKLKPLPIEQIAEAAMSAFMA